MDKSSFSFHMLPLTQKDHCLTLTSVFAATSIRNKLLSHLMTTIVSLPRSQQRVDEGGEEDQQCLIVDEV